MDLALPLMVAPLRGLETILYVHQSCCVFTIGHHVQARLKIGMMNLAYNLRRLACLKANREPVMA